MQKVKIFSGTISEVEKSLNSWLKDSKPKGVTLTQSSSSTTPFSDSPMIVREVTITVLYEM